MGAIVVGVDGSEGASAALRFAAEEARLRGAELRAVMAFHIPVAAYGGPLVPPDVGLVDDLRTAARATVERALDELGDLPEDLRLELVVREGQPARVLLDEARDADVLVVGSRGLGGFRGLLLGSVGQQCAHHAACPVVIVRPRRELSPEG
jgi:nucleotide-binding universal stress UspA family protein